MLDRELWLNSRSHVAIDLPTSYGLLLETLIAMLVQDPRQMDNQKVRVVWSQLYIS